MSNWLKFLIGLLFISSGITSLVYETLWIRVLSLGVGSTSTSMSMVLSIFFLGLSIGSFVAGKFINRVKSPLLVYGVIEGLIGVYGFAIIYVLLDFHQLLAMLPLTGTFSWLGTFLKFFLVFVFLLIPTLGMGATLPILVRIFTRSDSNVGRTVSVLYAVNTFGAVFGAFLTGYFFIPKFGVLVSNHAMAVANLGILLVAFILHKFLAKDLKSSQPEIAVTKPTARLRWTRIQKLVLLACGVCGFTSIASEVVWNKYLGIFFGTNIYGLGLILALFLLGIALGSLILSSFIKRIENKVSFFIGLLLFSVVTTLVASYLLNFTPLAANIISYYLGSTVSLLTIKTLLVAFILFIPTTVFGALLPLGINILTDSGDEAPRVTGVAYSINTIGSILGSYLAGIVLIPLIGSGNTLRLVVIVLLAIVVLLLLASDLRKKARLSGLFIVLVLGLSTFSLTKIEFKSIIKAANHQYLDPDLAFSDVLQYFSKEYEEFVLIVEGRTAVISLSHEFEEGEDYKNQLRLKTNGLNESFYELANMEELPKFEGLLGLLPYVFSEKPKSAFTVGYGGGYTVDFLTATDLELVHVVELEDGILQAADVAHKGENPLLSRKNLKLEVEDARFALAAKLGGPYDIIVSQPSQSWLSGVANLFTKEFFEIVKGNLTEKGVFSQWLNLWNMDEKVLKSILHTYFSVFPHGAVFSDLDEGELILLGSNSPLQLNSEKLKELTNDPEYKRKLVQIPFETPYGLITNFSMGRERALEVSQDAPLNTDINAYAEVNQSAMFYRDVTSANIPQKFLSASFVGDYESMFSGKIPEPRKFYYQTLLELSTLQKYDKYFVTLEKYEKSAESSRELSHNLGYLCFTVERFASAERYLKQAIEQQEDVDTINLLMATYIQVGRYQDVVDLASKYKNRLSPISRCHLLDANVKLRKKLASTSLYTKLMKQEQDNLNECGDDFNRIVGEYAKLVGNHRQALDYLEAYNEVEPDDLHSLASITSTYLELENWVMAKKYGEYFNYMLEEEKNRLLGLADYYFDSGLRADAEVLRAKAASY